MYSLPGNSKRWNQPNNSDRFGSLSYTRGIDFDREGYLKLAKRSRAIYDTSLDAQFGSVIGIASDGSAYIILTDDQVFEADLRLTTITQHTDTGVPTTLLTRSDIEVFNGEIHIAAGNVDGLRSWNGSSWDTDYAVSGGILPMCVFKNQNALAIGQGNSVILLDTSYTLLQTLTLPDEYQVNTLDYSNNRLYVGTRNQAYGEALMFEWDGNTSSANNAYACGAPRIDSIKAYGSTVVAFTGIGQLLRFNGSGFDVLANHPLYYTDYFFTTSGQTNVGPTSHRSMVVDGDIIYVSIKSKIRTSPYNDLELAYDATSPGGIWCYDPFVGFYQKHSISADLRLQSNAVTTANVNATTDIVTISSPVVPPSGTPVFYDDGGNGDLTAIGGLVHRKKYYTVYQSDTTFKLATTYANAIAGTTIDLTGTGNNAQYFIFYPNRDFGGDYSTDSTAITLVQSEDPVRSDGMVLLFGGTIGKTTVTETEVLNTLVEGQENRGCAITSRLDASADMDVVNHIYVKFQGLKTAEDKIIVKYRTAPRYDALYGFNANKNLTGTWTDADTFTSTATALADAIAGDEVTIHSGTGMGYTAHIISITENAGTYTVNLDETIQNLTASDTMLFTVQNWIKSRVITTDSVMTVNNDGGTAYSATSGTEKCPINKVSSVFELKIELRGEDVLVEDVIIGNKSFKDYVV